jgi:hypothetical protein
MLRLLVALLTLNLSRPWIRTARSMQAAIIFRSPLHPLLVRVVPLDFLTMLTQIPGPATYKREHLA